MTGFVATRPKCVPLSFQVATSTIRGGNALSDDQVLSNYFTLHTISLGDIRDR